MNSYYDQPAFPATLEGAEEWSGLTKREHLAAMVFQGMIASGRVSSASTSKKIAVLAINYADALIEAFEME
jgi:hypothetical protein|tara:strand:+ start:274 stop:486 length:213 start_codon:yes stop_codon:yes gene_type:complete